LEYQFESIGPALRWIVLAFLFVFVMAVVAAAAGVAALPGWIARRRRHPQATAINACGWFGLPTGINEKPTMFAVRVRLDDAERRLPGGARGPGRRLHRRPANCRSSGHVPNPGQKLDELSLLGNAL
jgi:hypothetical protein